MKSLNGVTTFNIFQLKFENYFIFLKSLKSLLNSLMLKTVYFFLTQSIVSYGIVIWGGTYNIHLIYFTVIILIKIILKKPYPTNNLYKDFNVLNSKNIYYKYLILC